MKSFGLYEAFDRDSEELPRFLKRTVKVPARVGTEFGYILHITGGKGKRIDFVIDHPPFVDARTGETAPPFTGEVFINSNDYRFFLGDTIWLPVEDKMGPWTLITSCQDKLLAEKTLTVVGEDEYDDDHEGHY